MRPDKAKVVDDARIEVFLVKGPLGEENAEFSAPLYVYPSKRTALQVLRNT